MRFAAILLTGLFTIVDLSSSRGADLPRFRPALPETGSNSLINQIDRDGLFKRGQKDGGVMFCCCITSSGGILWYRTYRATPNSASLKAELERCLEKSHFSPAIYEHQPVQAIYYGTLSFAILEQKPRLRIFANQQLDELKTENDFIGPQPIYGAGSRFSGYHYPENIPVVMSGVGLLALKIDASGNVQGMHVENEDPPLTGFGQKALQDFQGTKFIPAFRDGDPVECNILLPVFYEP